MICVPQVIEGLYALTYVNLRLSRSIRLAYKGARLCNNDMLKFYDRL